MIIKKYKEEDYNGCYNLLKSEKSLILKALEKTKDTASLCKMLAIGEKDLFIKLFSHSISV